MHPRTIAAVLALSVLVVASSGFGQAQSSNDQQPAYTFHTGTRVVLTDVTVTDRHGNPVHGLKASEFKIYDNNKPQTIATFAEHTTTPVTSLPRISTAPGIYSNAFLGHLPPVLNIIVLDTTNLEIPDQMYLNYELTRFFKALPSGEPVALYWHTGPASFLLQNFTSNRSLLLAALHKALPHFPPTGREYYSDLATLHKIALDFGQYPGRKSILWFSGGSTLYLLPDPTATPDLLDQRYIYDELEASRIAVYPIDARGLMVGESSSIWAQQALMTDIAQTTGGHAYYNNNGFDQTAAAWLKTSGDFYTITYSPANFHADNKWHKVRVTLSGDAAHCTLSYRRGYFADSLGSPSAPPQKKARTVLLAGGDTAAEPDFRSIPLVFQAGVIPASKAPGQAVRTASAVNLAPPQKGTIPYSIHYTLPLAEFTPKTVDGKQQVELGVAAFSFDKNGATITRLGTRLKLGVNEAKLRQSPNATFPFNQRINLRKGQNYIYLAIWDMHSGRLGTLQIPFQAVKPPKERK